MSTVRLPKNCTIEELAAELNAIEGDWESLVLFLPENGFVDVSTLTFLGAWGRQQRQQGRRLVIKANEKAEQEFVRMGFHEHLGLAYSRGDRPLTPEPFVPLHLITSPQDMIPAGRKIRDVVLTHFENGEDFAPALEWAVDEIFDNVTRHAEAADPGAVYAEYHPQRHRFDVAICDLGRGIRASLSEQMALYSDGHAIKEAIQRGVTRDEEIGQGNGLAGVLEIVRHNGGTARIWSGNAVLIQRGDDQKFEVPGHLPGTGVSFSLDSRRPVNLEDTWVADVAGPEFLKKENGRFTDKAMRFLVADECESTGMRSSAQVLRMKILDRLESADDRVSIDFSGVTHATSSFLDELLGRLAKQLGVESFHERVDVQNLTDRLERMANVVINQRIGRR